MANKALSKLGWRRFSGSHSRVAALLVFAMLLTPALALILTMWGDVIEASPDIETLRPNGAGYYQEWDYFDMSNWEDTSDQDDGTFIFVNNDIISMDTEALQDPTFGDSDTINSVTAYIRVKVSGGGAAVEKAVILWRTYDTDYESGTNTISRVEFTDYSETKTLNPNTGSAWTKTEVTALQTGIRASTLGSGEMMQCSEIWIVVDSTAADIVYPTQPTLYLPENNDNVFDTTPYIEWENAENAENHRLLVSADQSFTDIKENRTILNDNKYTIADENALAHDDYWYKVIAVNENGENESVVWVFNVITIKPTQPTLYLPSDGDDVWDTTPYFEWTNGENADNHRLLVDESPPDWAGNAIDVTTTENNYTPTSPLTDDNYSFKVVAQNENGENSSAVWTFNIKTVKPTQPTLYLPSDGDNLIDNTPYFEWTLSENAENYKLLIDNDSNFSSPEENRIFITENCYTPASENSFPDENYSWKVVAVNENGENESSTWAFVIQCWMTPPSVESVCGQVAGNENIYAIDDNVESYWKCASTHLHEIVFDMERVYNIRKIRLYQEAGAVYRWGQAAGLTVWASENTTDWGDNVWEGALDTGGWQENGNSFLKEGRYIKLVSKSDSNLQRMYEFDACVAPPLPTQPTLYLPADETVTADNTPYFEWENGLYADNHRLLADNDSDFSSPEENRIISNDNKYTIENENALLAGNYSWKVIAVNENGEKASDVWLLRIGTVTTENATNVGSDNATLNATITLVDIKARFRYKSEEQAYLENQSEEWFLSEHEYSEPSDAAQIGDWANRTPVIRLAASNSSQADKDNVAENYPGYQASGEDDHVQILDASDNLPDGGTILLSQGDYKIASMIMFSYNNQSLIGENADNTTVYTTSTSLSRLLHISTLNVLIENIIFSGAGRIAEGELIGIKIARSNTIIRNVVVENVACIGIYAEISESSNDTFYDNIWVRDSTIRNTGHTGIAIASHNNTSFFTNVYILSNLMNGTGLGSPSYEGEAGIVFHSVDNSVIANNTVENTGKGGIRITTGGSSIHASKNILVQGNKVRNNSRTETDKAGIQIGGSSESLKADNIQIKGNDIDQFYAIELLNTAENSLIDNNSFYNTVIPYKTKDGTGHTIQNNEEPHFVENNYTDWEEISPGSYSKDVSELHVANLHGFAIEVTTNSSPEIFGDNLTFLTEGLGQPQLYYPEDNSFIIDTTPTFEWTNGAGASYHRLIVNDNQEFGGDNEIALNFNVPENSYTGSLSSDQYWWKVIAVYGDSENESDVWTFTVNTPPSVENLYITDVDNVAENDLAPQTQYKFWVEISDNETLADIENVTLVVYLDNENLPDNEADHYTFRWTRDGGFEEVGPGGEVEVTAALVDGNVGGSFDTRLPFQHKAFYINGRFWLFYYDLDFDDNVAYWKTSVDGTSWGSRNELGVVASGDYFDVWWSGENFDFVRIPWTPEIERRGYYRCGVPLDNGDIDWIGDWYGLGAPYKHDPHIVLDSGGYPWIAYISDDDYNPTVIKSSIENGTGWTTDNTWMLDYGYSSLKRGQPIIAPLDNGMIYAIYSINTTGDIGDNQIYGKLWDGSSWGEKENASTSLVNNTGWEMFSATNFGNNIYVVFLSKDDNNIIFIERTWGVGWGDEENIRINATDKSTPALIVNQTTGDAWVFWSEGDNIYYRKRNVNGTLGDITNWYTESDGLAISEGYGIIGTGREVYDNKLLVYYTARSSAPFAVKFSYLDLNAYDHLIPDNCVAGDDAKTIDNFIFAIEFGEDATVTDADNWDVWVQVYDSAGNEDNRFFLNQFDIVSAAPPPQEYERPVEQGFSITESAPRGAEFGRMIEQSFSFGAVVTIVMEVCRLLSQAFGFAGTVGVTSEWRKSLTQDFSLTGDVSANMERWGSIDQTFSLDGSVSAVAEYGRSVEQGFFVSATVEAVVDEFVQEYERSIEQDFSLTGFADANREFDRGVAQGFSLTDAVSANMEREGAIDQSFSLAGVVGVSKEISRSIAQDFSFTDEVEAVVERFTQEYERPIEQDFSLNGSVEANRELGRGIAQGFSLTESIAVGKEIAIDLSDAFSLSATVTAPASFVRELDEELSFTATLELQYEYSKSLPGDFSFDATIDVAVQRIPREYERGVAQGFSFEDTIIAHEYGDIYVTSPWCDGRANPIDVVVDPTFSAIYTVIDNNIPNPAQFIQIQVGTSLNDNDLWDNISAVTVENGQRSPNVSYDGMPLTLNSSYWWRCRLGDSNGNLTEWTSPQTFGYQEAPFNLVAAAMFIFPIVLMIIAFAFDNVVFASFAGIVFILSGLFFVDVIWLAIIFIGVGVYLLITAFLSEED